MQSNIQNVKGTKGQIMSEVKESSTKLLEKERSQMTYCLCYSHPLIDIVGQPFWLKSTWLISALKYFFIICKKIPFTDMKSICTKRELAIFITYWLSFSSYHVRKILQEGKFFTCKMTKDKFISGTNSKRSWRVEEHENTARRIKRTGP